MNTAVDTKINKNSALSLETNLPAAENVLSPSHSGSDFEELRTKNISYVSPRFAAKYNELWRKAARISLLGRDREEGLGSVDIAKVQKMQAAIDERLQALSGDIHVIGNDSDLNTSQKLLGKKGAFLQTLAEVVAAISGRDVSIIAESIRSEFLNLLNHSLWTSVKYSHISVLAAGVAGQYQSAVLPLNQEFAREFPIAANFVEYGARGLSSGSLKEESFNELGLPKLANGWLTTLINPDGKKIFAGFRSATPVYYGITDSTARSEKTDAATEELLLAAYAEEVGTDLTSFAPAAIKIASFDLQTRVESTHHEHALAIERGIIDESFNALKKLESKKTIRIKRNSDLPEVELPISVSVLNFNFPVHQKSFQENLGYHEKALDRNTASVNALLKEANDALGGNGLSTIDAIKIKMLVVEILRMKKKCPSELTNDPHRFNSRLINLAYLLGYKVHFNCRSGKDRTGIIDAEAKFVAEALDVAVRSNSFLPPNCERPLSTEEQQTIAGYALNAGSTDIQRLNSGVPGSKLKPVTHGPLENDPLVNRIGTENWEEFKGLSFIAST